MPSLKVLVTLAMAVVNVCADFNPTPTFQARSINPIGVVIRDSPARGVPAPLRRMTNAERLTRGMSLNPPKPSHVRRAGPSPSPCPTLAGVIAVSQSGGATGYVSMTANAFGEYSLTATLADALHVTFCNAVSPFDLLSDNGITQYPYVGLINGLTNTSPDLGSGNINYVYIGGVTQTPANSPPVTEGNSFTAATGISESNESAVWSLDATTMILTPQWVNTDSSTPQNTILYVPADDGFVVTGNPNALALSLNIIASPVTFTFIPDSP